MTSMEYEEIFRHVPKLAALYHRLKRAAIEQRGFVFVGDGPMLVDKYGALSEEQGQACYFGLAGHLENHESVLWHELELIARGIREGRYTRRQLKRLGTRSEACIEGINAACLGTDQLAADLLQISGTLHS